MSDPQLSRRLDDTIFLLPRKRGRIEEGEAAVPLAADMAVAASASPTLPSPASGGGYSRWDG
jgi:hypothetical protein